MAKSGQLVGHEVEQISSFRGLAEADHQFNEAVFAVVIAPTSQPRAHSSPGACNQPSAAIAALKWAALQ